MGVHHKDVRSTEVRWGQKDPSCFKLWLIGVLQKYFPLLQRRDWQVDSVHHHAQKPRLAGPSTHPPGRRWSSVVSQIRQSCRGSFTLRDLTELLPFGLGQLAKSQMLMFLTGRLTFHTSKKKVTCAGCFQFFWGVNYKKHLPGYHEHLQNLAKRLGLVTPEAKTAADFAHQAAEAAETARQGRSSNALALTKSIAHSAIVGEAQWEFEGKGMDARWVVILRK